MSGWVKSRHAHEMRRPLYPQKRTLLTRLGCPLCAINVRFASRRTAAKFASLFDEAGGGDIVS